MVRSFKSFLKRTPFVKFFIFIKGIVTKPASQNEETVVLKRLLSRFDVPKRFVEFGFSGWEFNCASLVDDWEGFLIDGALYNVQIANTILPSHVLAEHHWLTLEKLDIIRRYVGDADLGVLSIDVDGNDYWFLKNLIGLKPSIIVVEYNSSFGLRPFTVPYDPNFDRTKKHESWLYYGASLSALTHLAEKNGYRLIEVTQSGINAFFVRMDLLTKDDIALNPEYAFREKLFPNGARPSQQWNKISHLPFVDVTKMVAGEESCVVQN